LARQSELLAVLQERLKLDSKNSSKPPSLSVINQFDGPVIKLGDGRSG